MAPSPFTDECVAEFECIFNYDTMHPPMARVERLARKHGLTKYQVNSWFGYRRRKMLKAQQPQVKPSELPTEATGADILPIRGSQYTGVAYASFTAEQLVALHQADESDADFMELIAMS